MRALLLALAVLSSGCIVVRTPRPVRVAACPPGHHWNGFACVHNGHR